MAVLKQASVVTRSDRSVLNHISLAAVPSEAPPETQIILRSHPGLPHVTGYVSPQSIYNLFLLSLQV